ncbi:ankyrin repeat-containing protein [Astrocystis sublimbata]|nr:ankyrin repeat-containing protein [Astrocystis sublimbata]
MPPSIADRLRFAIATGNLEGIRIFLATYRYDLQMQMGDDTLLQYIALLSARHGVPHILDWCFRSRFQMGPDVYNNNLYDEACFSRSPEIFNVMIAHGVDISKHHSDLGDALSIAAYYGNVELARVVLQAGVNPNQTHDYRGYEAAVLAVAGPCPKSDIIRYMLQYGWTQYEESAHIAAAETGNLEALKLLVEAAHGPDLEHNWPWWPQDYEEYEVVGMGTALHRAALKGQEETARYLVEQGACVYSQDELGRSCLWAAREGGNRNIIKMLEDIF